MIDIKPFFLKGFAFPHFHWVLIYTTTAITHAKKRSRQIKLQSFLIFSLRKTPIISHVMSHDDRSKKQLYYLLARLNSPFNIYVLLLFFIGDWRKKIQYWSWLRSSKNRKLNTKSKLKRPIWEFQQECKHIAQSPVWLVNVRRSWSIFLSKKLRCLPMQPVCSKLA